MMRTRAALGIWAFGAVVLAGQQVRTPSPWEVALETIREQTDDTARFDLMNKFIADYGFDPARRDALLWIYPRRQAIEQKRQHWPAVIETGEKALALDPQNASGEMLPVMVAALKAAEALKDTSAVRSWCIRTSALARAAVAAPRGASESEAAAKERVDYSRQVDIYTEYAMANAALQYAGTKYAPDLLALLEKQNARSTYLPQACQGAFNALKELNKIDEAAAVTERCFERQGATEDMLMVAADHYLRKNTAPDKVIRLASGAVAMIEVRAKPEGITDAAWKERKDLVRGLGYWMAGVTRSGQNQFAEADQQLRLALPLIGGNRELLAQALFHLGLANFRLGEKAKNNELLKEAARFSKRCAEMPGPLQAQAAKNLKVIETQYGIKAP